MDFLERLCEPLGLLTLLISVVITGGVTTASVPTVPQGAITTTTSNIFNNNSTEIPATLSNTTGLPAVVTDPVAFASTESEKSNSSNVSDVSTAPSNATAQPDNALTPSSNSSTSSPPAAAPIPTTLNATMLAPDLGNSSADSSNNTTPAPPRPEDTNGNTNPDSPGRLTTPTLTSSPTPRTTQKAQASILNTPQPVTNGDRNPYADIPRTRPQPAPLGPLTQQQQQQLLSPWLFLGSDYFPFFMLANQQSNQQASSNVASNSFAPLYMTAMEKELWPLRFTQQRSQQQLTSPQLQRQSFPNQNRFPVRQNQPQHIQYRNNMANTWFLLNELY